MSGYDPAPQFNGRGDMMPPNLGYTPRGDVVAAVTNARGDVTMFDKGFTPLGDPIVHTSNSRGDVVHAPSYTEVTDTLGELTLANAMRYLHDRQVRAFLARQAMGPVVAHSDNELDAPADTEKGSNHEYEKPKWTGYEDFRLFKRHGIVDLDYTNGRYPEPKDLYRNPDEAEQWRLENLTADELVGLGYFYEEQGVVYVRNEEEAAHWRIEQSTEDNKETNKHFLELLLMFRHGSTAGNFWKSSRLLRGFTE